MATVAELRMDVDSRPVRTADKDLDRLEKQAGKTERTANDMGRAVDRSGKEIEQTGRKAQGASRKMGGLEKAVNSIAVRATTAATAFAGVALAATSFGSIKIASAFEGEFSKVETLLDNTSFSAGALNDNIEGLKSGLLELRSASGDSFENLSKGLFDLVSAGVAAEDSIRVLTDANVLAKAGVTDVSVAVDGLTTVINAYGEAAGRSEELASKFFTAQKFGKTTVEELASGIGRVAASASEFGITLDELFAVQAAATAAGINQAEAFTGLRAVFGNLVQQEARAADEAKRLGIEFNTSAVRAKGLTQFLSEVQESANFTETSFERLFRSTEALNLILAITGDQGGRVYAKTLSELSDETKSVATLQEAYSRVLDDTEQKTGRLTGTLSALSVAIGAGLAPAFGNLVDNVTAFLRGDDFAARLEGITAGVADIVGSLAANWHLVERGATAAATAATAYLAINIATSVATTLNLAAAWRSVEKAVKGAAASTALLGAASGATGLKGMIAGVTGLVSIVGRAVFSFAALRAAVAGVGVAISALGGPVTIGIVAAITAIVTFRREIGSALKAFTSFASEAIAGTDDLDTALQATANVLERRIEPLVNAVSDAFASIKTVAVTTLQVALEKIGDALQGIADIAGTVRQAIIDLVPPEAIAAMERFAEAAGKALRFLERATPFGFARQAAAGFADDVRDEVERIEEQRALIDDVLNRRTGPVPDVFEDLTEQASGFGNALMAIGENTAIGVIAGKFNILDKSVEAVNDNIEVTAQRLDGLKAPDVGSVEQALRDQLAVSQRLAEAATGGKISYEIELNDAELDEAARKLVDKAEKAGEELSFAAARMLVGQIDSLEKAADAMLDAEKRLRDRAAAKADDIAQGLDDRIRSFEVKVQDADLRFAGPNADDILDALDRQFQGLADEIDNASIGLNEEQLDALYDALADAGVLFEEKIKEGARVGAFGLAASIRQAIEDGASKLQVIADVVTDFAGAGRDIVGSLGRAVDRIRDPNASISDKLLGSIEDIGGNIANAIALIPGAQPVAAAVKAVSEVAGLVKETINFFKDLFGKNSNFTAQGVFNAVTGQVAGVAQDRGADDNARARDALIDSITEAGKQLTGLLGGAVQGNLPGTAANEKFLNVAVRSDRKTGQPFIDVGFQGPAGEPTGGGRFTDPQQAFDAAIKLVIQSLRGGEAALVSYAQTAAKSGQGFDEIVNVLGVLNNALESGQDSLAAYAIAAAKGGLSADQITDGLNKIDAVLKLAAPELSNVEQALKDIDEAVNPAINSLKAVGQSFAEIAAIGDEAARRVGESFIDGVRELNLRLKNETLADYKQVLDTIAQRQNDAFALLERGAITQGEFDFVQSTGGLQAAQFFKGLDQEARDNLADYLGILGEVSGDVAVARARLEEQFDYLIDNVEETASGFEEAARNFERLGQNLRQTAESIRVEFSGLTPRSNVDTLLGRLSELRSEGLQGNQSALEALPQVVTSLVQSARQAFGGTAEFARIRDIGLSALDDTAGVAEELAKQNYQAAENARTDVELLTDIRNLIDDDRQITTLQDILDSGRLTNQLIAEQIQAFLNLFGQDGRPANEVSIEDLQAAATQAALDQQGMVQESASSSQSAPASASGASGGQATDTQISRALTESATATDRQTNAINFMREEIEDLTAELRRQGVNIRAA